MSTKDRTAHAFAASPPTPTPMPPDVQACVDPASGHPYFYHRKLRRSSWLLSELVSKIELSAPVATGARKASGAVDAGTDTVGAQPEAVMGARSRSDWESVSATSSSANSRFVLWEQLG